MKINKVKIVRGSRDYTNDRLLDMGEYEDEYEILFDKEDYMIVLNTRTSNTYTFKQDKIIRG